MRSWGFVCVGVLAVGCSNDVDPRVIPGGGVGDGEIDGELNVHIIDEETDAPIANATVEVGGTEKETDEDGLAVFADVEGRQTIAVKVTGFRSTVWVGANGANVTIPIPADSPGAPDQAVLAGTIDNWAQDLPQNHIKAALVTYSQTDILGDDANDIVTPAMGNICLGVTMCAWRVNTRTGNVTLAAAIVDRDGRGTLNDDDDTNTIIGWAIKENISVENGVNQSGMTLALVEAGKMQQVTVDLGTPPAALTTVQSLVGIEIGNREVVQIPMFILEDPTSVLSPKPEAFTGGGTYRLTAVAQTSMGEMGPQSIIIRQGLTGTALAAGEWLVPPTDVSLTQSGATFTPSEGALAHFVEWRDAQGETTLQILVLDGSTEVEIPALVALPSSGISRGGVQAIGADFDL
ncbi:MAG: hypothetical protein ACKV2T_24260, partial [Kofleriaceae bacterium]